MTQDERNTQQIVRAMPWETVALEPDPAEVEKIDQQVPLEWRQTLEQEQEHEKSRPCSPTPTIPHASSSAQTDVGVLSGLPIGSRKAMSCCVLPLVRAKPPASFSLVS